MKSFGFKSALLFGAANLVAGAAIAQDAAPATDNLGEIVVTAQRRSENLERVPVSVGVLTGDATRSFTAGGDDTLLALSGRVPSFYAETTTGRIFPRFYIRGLGNIDFYLGASQPVSIIQDDVILEHVVLKSNPVYDLAQVEVLRGPQGSLFGRNTTAGIVKFDTIKPTNSFQGRVDASYGSFNTVNIDAGIGGPIVADKIAFRLSGLYQHRDNWVDNTFTGTSADGTVTPKKDAMAGYDDRNVRLQLLLTPTENLSILASAHVRDYHGTSTLFQRAHLVKGSNTPLGLRGQVSYDEAQDNPQAYKTYGGSLRTSLDFGPATLTSITAYETTSGYSRGDTDGGAAANFPVNGAPNGFGQSRGNIRDLDQWTQELRLASNGDNAFKWQVGGLYFDNRDDTEFYQRGYFLNAGVAARNPNNWVALHDINTSWALFGQASYALTDQLTFTGGARVTRDSKSTRLTKAPMTAAGVDSFPATAPRYVKLADTRPSWDASLLYQVDPDFSVYARVADGFRGPTIQGRSAVFSTAFTTADSERNLSGEIGFKSKLLDDRLRFNATAFAYRVKGIQLNGNDANGNGVLFNADKAKAYGVEADVTFKPVRNFTLSAGASYLHSRIDDKNVYAQVCALNGVVVCTVQDPTITRTIFGAPAVLAQIDGDPLPNAPEYNLNFMAHYDIPLNASTKLFVETDWNVQGYTQFVLYKTKEFTADGNFEGGAKAGVSFANGQYEFSVFARNITNEKNLKGVIENYMAAVYNDPRVIGASFGARF
jgi:iron complex outermembrane receptor protein